MEQKLRRDCNMGENLKKLRKKNQLSQEKLCIELELHSCDISRSAYQKYEAGKLNIPIRVLIQLKKIYECTYEDFFANLDPNKNTS